MPIFVSKSEPGLQVVAVMFCPLPVKEYHTPGLVLRVVPQSVGAPVVVALEVLPETDWPQLMLTALLQRSFTTPGLLVVKVSVSDQSLHSEGPQRTETENS